jgi:hypothetical protein
MEMNVPKNFVEITEAEAQELLSDLSLHYTRMAYCEGEKYEYNRRGFEVFYKYTYSVFMYHVIKDNKWHIDLFLLKSVEKENSNKPFNTYEVVNIPKEFVNA